MAAINLSTLPSSSALRVFSSHHPRNALNLSFNSQNISRSTSFPSISSKPNNTKRLYALTVASALKKLSETELFTVPGETEELAAKIPSDSGVYAVYDKNGDLQFIGISRSIAASVLSHLKSVPDLCCSLKVN